ncbi:MAG: LysR family transcriptional regulator [Rubrivivax sp.]
MDRIRRLELLIRAAEAGGFSRAAGLLQIDPSAVSHAVAALEKELGLRLFHRTTRQLSLTDEGRHVVEHARVVLRELEAIGNLGPAGERQPEGVLRVGMSVSFSHHVVMPRIGEFLRRHPGIRVESLLLATAADMHAAGLDLVFQSGRPKDSGLVAQRLATLKLGVYASPTYLARAGRPETPQALLDHACLVHKPQFIRRAWNDWDFVRDRRLTTIKVPTRLMTDDREGLVAAALAGAGIIRVGLLDPVLVGEGRLLPLLTEWACPGGPEIYVLYRKGGRDNPRLRVFLDFVTRVFDEFDPHEGSLLHHRRSSGDAPAR